MMIYIETRRKHRFFSVRLTEGGGWIQIHHRWMMCGNQFLPWSFAVWFIVLFRSHRFTRQTICSFNEMHFSVYHVVCRLLLSSSDILSLSLFVSCVVSPQILLYWTMLHTLLWLFHCDCAILHVMLPCVFTGYVYNTALIMTDNDIDECYDINVDEWQQMLWFQRTKKKMYRINWLLFFVTLISAFECWPIQSYGWFKMKWPVTLSAP